MTRAALPGCRPAATVLYGSQTGHAEHLAADLVARIGAAGLSARLCAADEYPRRELRDEQLLLVIISTQGDGDPPDNARELLDFLNGRRAPRLESLRYAVLALGDFELSPVLPCRAAGRWEAGRARGAANASSRRGRRGLRDDRDPVGRPGSRTDPDAARAPCLGGEGGRGACPSRAPLRSPARTHLPRNCSSTSGSRDDAAIAMFATWSC